MIPDLITCCFELFGAPFIVLSILKLHREKQTSGVSWLHVGFFTCWGFWNLYYYPHLNQWLAFSGGIAIVIANTVWLVQLLYYANKAKTSI
jgi:hypothetical protein